ncbi:hypothetical protein MYSTI_03207 [Myxococcus stipitatus DSM 14675]|uniref:Uncharacterized protein n=1 Tax=Myxococcus stipitatus (strain DSM 14675 / JCM 12634 / Mx s8) TaxID=1278073 RepID=L7U9K2_MYXSD|nr:hypothetical protein [Myxococcus stipitatus]AGC44520.1 hypothetical protein MYSTI_03207 [Myxococcus stipitatus DSM 14675]
MPRNPDAGPEDPSLHDEDWRAFTFDKEANSLLAKSNWTHYRRGLRRLEKEHSAHVPGVPMRRALAEDAFFCATHWKQNRRIVRGALRGLLDHPLGVSRYTFAAAEYWKWASACSPADVQDAEQMLARARIAMETADPLTQGNLAQMLRQLKPRRSKLRITGSANG